MSDTKSPGQIAYEAGCRVHEELYPKVHRVPWRELHPAHKRGWEAAAQAVLAQCVPQEEPPRRWTPQPLVLDLDPDVRREAP